MTAHYIINNTYHFTLTPYLLDMYSSAVLLNNILLLLLVLLLLTMPANGVAVPESNDSVISSSSMSSALIKSLSSGRIMSAVNDVLSLLAVWGDSDTDDDMAGVVMTGIWSLSFINGVGDLFLNCGSLLPNKVLKT